jgi:hypothetical protein
MRLFREVVVVCVGFATVNCPAWNPNLREGVEFENTVFPVIRSDATPVDVLRKQTANVEKPKTTHSQYMAELFMGSFNQLTRNLRQFNFLKT